MASSTKAVAPKTKAAAPKTKAAAPKTKASAPKFAAPKVSKTASKRRVKKAEHPTYFDMIAAALTSMKDRRGSSRQAVRKYILENYKVDSVKMTVPLRLSLRNGLAKGKLCYARKSGKGSRCYKLVPKEKEAKKPAVKKVVKKVKAATDKKKVADKKKVEVAVAVEEETIEDIILYDFTMNSSFEEPNLFVIE